MNISLKILESNQQITKSILQILQKELSKTISKAIPFIQQKIVESLKQALKQEPEYASLLAGKLKAELGLPNSISIDSIVEQLANTTTVTAKPISIVSSGLSGGILIRAIQSDNISNIIFSDQAYVVDIKGYSMPWLEWLLLKGNETAIVKQYDVKYGSYPTSRSGMAVMVKSDQNWRVPPEFKGTADDNWTTRAISRIDTEITKIIEQEIIRAI